MKDKLNYDERVIYNNCIDFSKEILLRNHKKTLQEDKLVYPMFSDIQLKQQLRKFETLKEDLEYKISLMYLRCDKTNQRFCIFSQKEQENMRSLRWLYIEIIQYLDHLLKERFEDKLFDLNSEDGRRSMR